jgi:hypothetical protein
MSDPSTMRRRRRLRSKKRRLKRQKNRARLMRSLLKAMKRQPRWPSVKKLRLAMRKLERILT